MKVEIDGVLYIPANEHQNAEAMRLLADVYSRLWTEAYYDPFNNTTRDFAKPLSDKMMEANKLMQFGP